MAFLDDLRKSISMAGQEAASQTRMFAETARINSKISDEEKQMNSLFLQLGRSYYEANKNNPEADRFDIISSINDAQTRIGFYRDEIRKVKGLKTCPQCGGEVPLNSLFCSFCGSKVPEAETPALNMSMNKCPQCGSLVDNDSAFCTSCGCNLQPVVTNYPNVQIGALGGSLLDNNGSYSTPVMEKEKINFEIQDTASTENNAVPSVNLNKNDNF